MVITNRGTYNVYTHKTIIAMDKAHFLIFFRVDIENWKEMFYAPRFSAL